MDEGYLFWDEKELNKPVDHGTLAWNRLVLAQDRPRDPAGTGDGFTAGNTVRRGER
jgi:hypothetical protein